MKKNIFFSCDISTWIGISIFISILLSCCIFSVKYNSCMDGSDVTTTYMEYVDGKIDFSNIRTFQARYCQDTKGFNMGWFIKRIVIYEMILLGIILFFKAPFKNSIIKWVCLSVSILVTLIYIISIIITTSNDKSYINSKQQCCISNNGIWNNTYCEWENHIKSDKNQKNYDKCVNEAYKKYK